MASVIIVLFICAENSAFQRRLRKLSLLDTIKTMMLTSLTNDLREIFSLPLEPAILNDPNALWNVFKTKFLSVADKHAPIRQCRVRSEYKP